MTRLADDIVKRRDRLKTQRTSFEDQWQDAARYVLPTAPHLLFGGQWRGQGSRILSPATPEIYDSTAVWSVRRLAAGLESMIMPTSSNWHDLGVDDFFSDDHGSEAEQYLEKLRDYMFKIRYQAGASFQGTNQHALRQVIVFGTAIFRVMENFGRHEERRPVRYVPMNLGTTYLDVNSESETDTVYEDVWLTARQAVAKWGEKVSDKVRKAANVEATQDDQFEFIHAVQPREERGSQASASTNNSEWASYIVEVQSKHTVEDSGYFEFPVVDYVWDRDPGQPYGSSSPTMLAMPDIKTVNTMSKTQLRAGQQYVAPAWATVTGNHKRPNLNSNKINEGLLTKDGRLKIQPIHTGNSPDIGEALTEQRRNSIQQTFFINLFQSLNDDPNKTATQALIENEEKGQLLGPVGSNIQNGINRLVDREIGILERKGAFAPDSPFAVPEELGGAKIAPHFTSPLDKARKAGQAVGIERTLSMVLPMAEQMPEILDNYDFDEISRELNDTNGAPAKILVPKEIRDQKRQERQQQQQAMQAMQQAQMAGDAGQSLGAAAESLSPIAQAAQEGQVIDGQATESPDFLGGLLENANA